MLNPITYTEQVVGDFLRYQLSTYAFADAGLYQQMRGLLNLEQTRNTPLMKGPFISLSRTFQQGATLEQLVKERVLHPHIKQLSPYPTAYRHQEQAFRAIHARQPTLVATGTGSGKTECFLLPIISRCLQLRDESAPAGITAVIVYPMNALAEDQLQRMRALLAGTGVSFVSVRQSHLEPKRHTKDARVRVTSLRTHEHFGNRVAKQADTAAACAGVQGTSGAGMPSARRVDCGRRVGQRPEREHGSQVGDRSRGTDRHGAVVKGRYARRCQRQAAVQRAAALPALGRARTAGASASACR